MAKFDIVDEKPVADFSAVIDHSRCMERNFQCAWMVVGMMKRLYASVSFAHEYFKYFYYATVIEWKAIFVLVHRKRM